MVWAAAGRCPVLVWWLSLASLLRPVSWRLMNSDLRSVCTLLQWILKELRRRRGCFWNTVASVFFSAWCSFNLHVWAARWAHALMSPQTRVCLMQRTDCRQLSADWWTSAQLIFWEALFKRCHVPDLLPNKLITASLRLLLFSEMFFSSLFVTVQLF